MTVALSPIIPLRESIWSLGSRASTHGMMAIILSIHWLFKASFIFCFFWIFFLLFSFCFCLWLLLYFNLCTFSRFLFAHITHLWWIRTCLIFDLLLSSVFLIFLSFISFCRLKQTAATIADTVIFLLFICWFSGSLLLLLGVLLFLTELCGELPHNVKVRFFNPFDTKTVLGLISIDDYSILSMQFWLVYPSHYFP